MDYKKKLIEIIDYVNIQEENFITKLEGKKEEFLGSYDNWTFKDVVSHMSEWRLVASTKLESVKKNEYVSFQEDLNVINIKNYKKHKNDPIEDVKLLSTKSYTALKKQIQSFDNSELMGQSKIEGFNATLWQYVIIDSFLHPIVHMVLYYIKIQDFEKAFRFLEGHYILLLELDNSQQMINDFFYCEDLLDEMIDRNAILINLKAFQKTNINTEIISTVVLNHFMVVNNI